MGPITYARHLVSGPRLPFTAAYFGSIALTLYFAVGVSFISCILLPADLHRHWLAHRLPPLHPFEVGLSWRTTLLPISKYLFEGKCHVHIMGICFIAHCVFPVQFTLLYACSVSKPSRYDIICVHPIVPALWIWPRGRSTLGALPPFPFSGR